MGKSKPKEKPNIVLLTDPNSDPDDLASYILLAHYLDEGKIDCNGLVVTKGDQTVRFRRTKYAKGALNSLGQAFIKVCLGRDYETSDRIADNIFCDDEHCRSLENQGNAILRGSQSVFDQAFKKGKVTIVVNAPMPDLAAVLRNQGGNLREKIKKIVVMGDVCREKDGDIYYPDKNSHNNFVCYNDACEVFRIAQENNIRLVFVPRDAVYKLGIGHDFYDMLEKSDHLIAKCLVSCNKNFVSKLWENIKTGKCSHFDVHRFIRVFMGEDYKITSRKITLKDGFDKVWANIKYFNMYDVLSLMVAVDEDFRPYGNYIRLDEEKNVFIAEVADAESLKNKIYDVIRKKLRIKE